MFSIWVKILVGPGIDLLCHKTTSKYAKESVVKFLIGAVSLQYLLPITFMGKILYKATNKVSFPLIFHLHTTLLSPLHTLKFYLPSIEKYTTSKDKDQNASWIQEFALGCPWTPQCCPRNPPDSLELPTEYHTAPQNHKQICKILRNTFSMHSPYSTQWYKLAREVP